MTIDRGALARVDRRFLAHLRDDDSGRRLVKVPVSEAVWDVWRRYCRLARVTMGQGIAVLVARELDLDGDQPLDKALAATLVVGVETLRDKVNHQQVSLALARDQLTRRSEENRDLHQQLSTLHHQVEVLQQQLDVLRRETASSGQSASGPPRVDRREGLVRGGDDRSLEPMVVARQIRRRRVGAATDD